MASSSVHVGEMTGFEIQFNNIFCAFFKHLTLFDIHVYIFLNITLSDSNMCYVTCPAARPLYNSANPLGMC